MKDRHFGYKREMTPQEYESMKGRIKQNVGDKYPVYFCRDFKKESYSDVLCIVPSTVTRKDIFDTLYPNDMVMDKKTYYVLLDGYKIEIQMYKEEEFDTTKLYFDYSIGHFLDRLAVTENLRFKREGLLYPIFSKKNKSVLLKYVVLTKSLEKILDYLNVNNEIAEIEFTSEDEMFNRITSSKYFDSDDFYFNYKNKRSWTKYTNTPIIKSFFEHIKDLEIYNNVEELNYPLSFYEECFGVDIHKSVEEEYEKETVKDEVKKKFNGHTVISLWGFTDRKLGIFLEYFRNKYIEGKEFEFLKNSQETINEMIVEECKKGDYNKDGD